MSDFLAAALFVAAVIGLSGAACGIWFPGKYPPKCDTCGRRHEGECLSAAPARRVPSWAREEHI